MRLSIDVSYIKSLVGIFNALDMIKAAGFDAVDYSFHDSPEDNGENYLENARKIRSYLDEIGLTCNQAHAPFYMKYGDAFDVSEYNYLTVVRSIESAAILGADNIVVHAVVFGVEENNQTFEDYNYGFYKSLEPWAEKFGIKIAIENLFTYDAKTHYHGGIFANPDIMNALVERLNSPVFTVCLDTGHAFITGTKPHEFINGIKSGLLKALHIQESSDGIGDTHFLPYYGFIDWSATAKALKQYGYDGDLTFEIFKFFKNVPTDCLEAALCFAQSIGRHLIKLIEE